MSRIELVDYFMALQAIAEWIDDGLLHPPATVAGEFVDVDDFLRIPVDGLTEIVEFAHVRVGDISVIVFGPNGAQFRSLLGSVFRSRHPDGRQVFLSSASTGLVMVLGEDLAEVEALAVAVTQFKCAWDDSAAIRVCDDRNALVVSVAYPNDKYLVSADESAPTT